MIIRTAVALMSISLVLGFLADIEGLALETSEQILLFTTQMHHAVPCAIDARHLDDCMNISHISIEEHQAFFEQHADTFSDHVAVIYP